MHANVSFSIKLQVAGWKKTPVQVRYCEFYCVISKSGYLVEHVQTVASIILGYNYVGCLLWVHTEEMQSFLQHFGTHSFQINFRVLLNLKGAFRTISNIYDKVLLQEYSTAFSRCIFTEMLHHRYLIGFCIRLCSLVSLYFSTFFGWILEWTIWTFCYYWESVQPLSIHDVN